MIRAGSRRVRFSGAGFLSGAVLAYAALGSVGLSGCGKEETDPDTGMNPVGNAGAAGSTAGTAQGGGSGAGGSGGDSGGAAASGAGAGGDAAGAAGAGGAAACPVQGQGMVNGVCACPGFNPDECVGACTNLMEDPEYCGDCATACGLTSACNAGVCTAEPTEVAVVTGCMTPRMILADGVFYITDAGAGTVSSVPVAGGAPTVIATAQMMPGPIAADADGVYWANAGDSTIMKAPLTAGVAGTPEVLVPELPPVMDADAGAGVPVPAGGLAVAAGMLFFTHAADVFKTPTTAGADPGVAPGVLTCTEADALEGKLPIDPPGAAVPGATFVASSNASCTEGGMNAAVATNGTDVFYAVDIRAAVEANSVNGGVYVEMGESQGSLLYSVLTTDATNGYWATGSDIKRAPFATGKAAQETLVSTLGFDNVTGFAINATHVYLAGEEGDVMRAPLVMGSMAEPLARGQMGPSSLAVDATNVYWIGSDCRIMTTPLPL